MQFGEVRFDRQQGELYHQGRDERWQLPRAEFLVLTQLLDHPNIPLSKERLRCAGEAKPVMSGSAVVKAVFTLRKFLDNEAERLQTVPGKGYCWVREVVSSVPESSPPRARPRWLGGAAVALALLMLLVFYFSVRPTPLPEVQRMETVQLAQQSVSLIQVMQSDVTDRHLAPIAQQLRQGLSRCARSPWHTYYLALSNDGQVLNLTLRGEEDGLPTLRNLKISDFRLQPGFDQGEWLREVKLCE
ncbi:winged helix-turn-helix domain-containing protein [Ferrimonas marina]|uniref:DNA-binding winged helix-turn-helix (WHTH) domain-containing protein n=1 Tax=Ferrimonas marina TaxID=299255 RepID=A0A1M5NX37_9GAMM|nr:helix-turn-helix domain-containing protein [Ferrimonas marina]SHG94080.1 DNA-binding winged helix-turn-helix (wHTH) domain-containing protein [Ferrimonas marina]